MLNKEELEEEVNNRSIDFDTVMKFAPVILICLIVFIQYHFFVTPEQLEIKHRIILNEISEKYATKEQTKDIKTQLNDMQNKIDKIYDYVVKTR